MENPELFQDIFKRYGWSGLLTAFLVWNEFIKPRIKKDRPDFNVMLLDRTVGHLSKLQNRVDEHLAKEAQEDIMLAEMRGEQKSMKEKAEIENEHIFAQLKSLHDKFDTLTRIMLEGKK